MEENSVNKRKIEEHQITFHVHLVHSHHSFLFYLVALLHNDRRT